MAGAVGNAEAAATSGASRCAHDLASTPGHRRKEVPDLRTRRKRAGAGNHTAQGRHRIMRAARARIRVHIGGKLVDAADLPLLLLPAEIAEAEGLGILRDSADGIVGEAGVGGVLGLDLHRHVESHVGLLGKVPDDLVDDLRELGDRAPRIRQGDLAVEAPDAGDGRRLRAGAGRK